MRQDIVFCTLNYIHVWNNCKVLRLTRNLCLRPGLSNVDELRDFVDCILKVWDRKLGRPNGGEVTIDITKDLLI